MMRVAASKRSVLLFAMVLGSCMLIWAAPMRWTGPQPPASEPTRAAALENHVSSPGEFEVAFQRQRQQGQSGQVYKASVTPHWFANNTRFWYRNDLRGGGKEFILVEIE